MEAGFTGRSGEASAQGTRHPHGDILGVRHGGDHTTGLMPHLLENHVGRKAVPGKGRRETGVQGASGLAQLESIVAGLALLAAALGSAASSEGHTFDFQAP